VTHENDPPVASGHASIAARGVLWSVGGLIVAEPIRIAVIAFLARQLTPSDFGIVAIASLVVGLVAIGNDLGLQAAIIQRPIVTARALDSLYWLNLAIGLGLSGVVAVTAYPVAVLFDTPEAGPIIAALGLGLAVISFVQVQNAILRRAHNFRVPAIANVASVVSGGIVGLLAAAYGLGAWSLVVNSLVGILASAAIVQFTTRFRPTRHFAWSDTRGYLGLGSQLMLGDLLQYGAANVDNTIVGYSLGPALLGPYALAYNLVMYPVRRVSALVASVTLPSMARFQADTSRLSAAFVRSVSLTAAVVVPAIAAAFVVADDLIIGLYGPQWVAAVFPFRMLCIAAVGRSVAVHAENVFKATGRGSYMVAWSFGGFVVLGAAALLGVSRGLPGVAVGVGVATSVLGMWELVHANRLMGGGWILVPKLLILPALLGLASVGFSLLFSLLLGGLPLLVRALVSIVCSTLLALLVGWTSAPIADARAIVSRMLRK